MKPRLSNQQTTALTLIEVLVIIAVLAVLWALLMPAMDNRPMSAPRIACVSNLKQIGIAYRLWEGDHGDKYPMAVSVTNGGAMELIATGNVAAGYLVMSNELSTPKILRCPADIHRVWATNFSTGFDNSHISYFVGLDAAETEPQMCLSGDDNFAIGGVPVKSGVLQLLTNAPVTWTKTRHKFVGNIGMADGSVQQVTTDGLQKALQQAGTMNRLLIP
jgi:prepilin-type processing-associated H-X9-DG protein